MRDPAATPEESLPVSVELRIDAVCQVFEAAWQAAGNGGIRPRIEDYLGAAAEPERGPLLRELLRVELHYRRGENPGAEEYRRRFPAYAGRLAPPFQDPAPADRGQRAAPGDNRSDGAGGSEPDRHADETPVESPRDRPARG
jgi:hypothetical protein